MGRTDSVWLAALSSVLRWLPHPSRAPRLRVPAAGDCCYIVDSVGPQLTEGFSPCLHSIISFQNSPLTHPWSLQALCAQRWDWTSSDPLAYTRLPKAVVFVWAGGCKVISSYHRLWLHIEKGLRRWCCFSKAPSSNQALLGCPLHPGECPQVPALSFPQSPWRIHEKASEWEHVDSSHIPAPSYSGLLLSQLLSFKNLLKLKLLSSYPLSQGPPLSPTLH